MIHWNKDYIKNSRKSIKSSLEENLKGYLNIGDYVEQLDGDKWIAKVVDFNDDGSAIVDFINGSGRTSVSKEDIDKNFEKIDIGEKIDKLIENEKIFMEETGDEDDWYLNKLLKIKQEITSSRKSIKSSAGEKTNLPKNLVRQVLSNKITEDQAINRVMISQKCNRGVARVIFNRWMDQNRESIIKSDAAIAEIQNEFNPDGNLDSWAEIYMPGSGKANTKGGELIRAAQRILAAYYASEAMIGRGLGNELVNPAARYIIENTEFELNSDIQEMLDHDIHYDDSEYDSWLKSFETKFEDYLRNNSELFSEANDDDMDDYRKDEDSEFFLNKCYVEDDNGNEYFIESEDGEWKCTDIVASNENAYSVGDEISEGDVFFEKVNKSEEYGSFEENGTTYFYEASGNSGENGEFDTFKITEVQFTDQLFEKDSFVDYEKLEELCEDGKLFDVNGNQIHIEDFQRI